MPLTTGELFEEYHTAFMIKLRKVEALTDTKIFLEDKADRYTSGLPVALQAYAHWAQERSGNNLDVRRDLMYGGI